MSHLYKVFALVDSLHKHGESLLHVLVVDGDVTYEYSGCRLYSLNDLSSQESSPLIVSKYKKGSDKLRWSMKPVFMKFLLQKEEIRKLIYVDNDIAFFSSYDFLFEKLEQYSFILTPHYYKHSPKQEQNWFEANFRVGLFNAGFVGANKQGLESLQWWADCCAYRCEKNSFRGLFDDQKYLDLIPVINPDAHIVRHQGCNVAGWNKDVCKRSVSNEKVMINQVFPLVFVHFNDSTIRDIVLGEDPLLHSNYLEYLSMLKRHKPELQEEKMLKRSPFIDRVKFNLWKIITEFGI